MSAVAVAPVATQGLTRDAKHFYQWEGGPKVPGVTSVIKMLDKSGPLIGWAKRETAASAVRNLPMIQQMLAEGGEIAAIAWLKNIPDYQRDVSADLGSRVHVLAEAIARKQEVTVTPEEAPFINAYMAWEKRAKPKYIAAEFMVYSATHEYGGTGDAVIELGGERWLVDTKTGRNVYAETALQLAGLNGAEWSGRPGDPKKYRVPKVDRFGVLHVRPEGAQLVEYHVGEEEWAAFLACRALHKWVNGRALLVKEVQAA